MLSCWISLTANALTEDNAIPTITVMADRALTVPLTKLASLYSRSHNTSVSVTFAPSFEQTLAIEEGEPANVFISAHPLSFKRLQQQGLFDVYSSKPLIEAKLKLISSSEYEHQLQGFSIDTLKMLQKEAPDFLIATANSAATAEGHYSSQIFKKLRGQMFFSRHSVELQNTEDVLDFVRDNKGFGIILESDASQHSDLKSHTTFDSEWHEPLTFEGVVIAGEEMQTARDFLEYLSTAEAQRLFIKYGFYPAAAQ